MTTIDIIFGGLWIITGLVFLCAIGMAIMLIIRNSKANSLAMKLTKFIESNRGELIVKAPNIVSCYVVGDIKLHRSYSIFGYCVQAYDTRNGYPESIAYWQYERFPYLKIKNLRYKDRFVEETFIKQPI